MSGVAGWSEEGATLGPCGRAASACSSYIGNALVEVPAVIRWLLRIQTKGIDRNGVIKMVI